MFHTHGSLIISRSLVQQLTAVFLSGDRGRQVDGDHLKKSFTGWQPATHHGLQQGFALFIAILDVQLDVQLLDQLGGFILLEVHDGIKHLQREGDGSVESYNYSELTYSITWHWV